MRTAEGEVLGTAVIASYFAFLHEDPYSSRGSPGDGFLCAPFGFFTVAGLLAPSRQESQSLHVPVVGRLAVHPVCRLLITRLFVLQCKLLHGLGIAEFGSFVVELLGAVFVPAALANGRKATYGLAVSSVCGKSVKLLCLLRIRCLVQSCQGFQSEGVPVVGGH